MFSHDEKTFVKAKAVRSYFALNSLLQVII
jgi:hypothetical protein